MSKTSQGTASMIFVFVAIAVILVAAIGYRAVHAGDKAPASRIGRAGLHFEIAGKQPCKPPRFQRQVGGALFLSQGFHQRLHRGSPQFSA